MSSSTPLPDLEQLALDVISLAHRAEMPEAYWERDSRVARACRVLGLAPLRARTMAIEAAAKKAQAKTVTSSSSSSAAEVWTDGACSGNPGPGGWGWVTPDGEHGSGPEAHTTNQRMEIMAVIDALSTLPQRPIEVVTDSQYVINGATKWTKGWVTRGWVNSKGQPVANRDLWERLIPLTAGVTFRWVKGHAGHELNEAADALAVAARDAAPR